MVEVDNALDTPSANSSGDARAPAVDGAALVPYLIRPPVKVALSVSVHHTVSAE